MIKVHDLLFEPYITKEQIQERVESMGETLTKRYAGKTPHFIGILNGAFVFAADLLRHYQGNCEISFVRLASYAGTRSTGEVKTLIDLNLDIEGKDIVIVEDIVDSGRTLNVFLKDIWAQKPASVYLVCLLDKPEARKFPVPVDLSGMEIPDRFVVGYGLDYNGHGRNLPDIYQVVPVNIQ